MLVAEFAELGVIAVLVALVVWLITVRCIPDCSKIMTDKERLTAARYLAMQLLSVPEEQRLHELDQLDAKDQFTYALVRDQIRRIRNPTSRR